VQCAQLRYVIGIATGVDLEGLCEVSYSTSSYLSCITIQNFGTRSVASLATTWDAL
jgi:hypothetical protein